MSTSNLRHSSNSLSNHIYSAFVIRRHKTLSNTAVSFKLDSSWGRFHMKIVERFKPPLQTPPKAFASPSTSDFWSKSLSRFWLFVFPLQRQGFFTSLSRCRHRCLLMVVVEFAETRGWGGGTSLDCYVGCGQWSGVGGTVDH